MVVLRPLALVLLGCASLIGCSSDETIASAVGPQGDPTITITEPTGTADAPACMTVGDESDARGPLLVAVEELILRPPGACIFDQCGHLALYVEGVLNNESSVPAIDVLFRKLGDRYHDGSTSSATGEPDLLNVRIDVVNADGVALSNQNDEPLSAEMGLITVPQCP